MTQGDQYLGRTNDFLKLLRSLCTIVNSSLERYGSKRFKTGFIFTVGPILRVLDYYR